MANKPYQHDGHADKDSNRQNGHADKDLYWHDGRAAATSLFDPHGGDKPHTAAIPVILAQKQNPCTQPALRVRCKCKNCHIFSLPAVLRVCVCGGELQMSAWCINSTMEMDKR